MPPAPVASRLVSPRTRTLPPVSANRPALPPVPWPAMLVTTLTTPCAEESMVALPKMSTEPPPWAKISAVPPARSIGLRLIVLKCAVETSALPPTVTFWLAPANSVAWTPPNRLTSCWKSRLPVAWPLASMLVTA